MEESFYTCPQSHIRRGFVTVRLMFIEGGVMCFERNKNLEVGIFRFVIFEPRKVTRCIVHERTLILFTKIAVI